MLLQVSYTVHVAYLAYHVSMDSFYDTGNILTKFTKFKSPALS